MTAQLQDFFKTCELDGSQCVDIDSFRDLCSRLNISSHDADLIFEDLDLDHDGKISFSDFSKGFSNFLSSSSNSGVEDNIQEEVVKKNVWSTLTTEAEKVGNRTR